MSPSPARCCPVDHQPWSLLMQLCAGSRARQDKGCSGDKDEWEKQVNSLGILLLLMHLALAITHLALMSLCR